METQTASFPITFFYNELSSSEIPVPVQDNPVRSWYQNAELEKNNFTTCFEEIKTEQVLTLEAAWQASARTTEPVLFHPRLSNSLLSFSIKTLSFHKKSVTCNLEIRTATMWAPPGKGCLRPVHHVMNSHCPVLDDRTAPGTSVADLDPNPDPPDPHVFGSLGSRSISQSYGCGSGSESSYH
jgi:hypothetical protein